jgi:hypothetical protein
MHAEKLCHKWLQKVLPGMHRRRLSALGAIVGGAFRGGKLNVTSLGRSIRGNAKTKHSIKRADRLLSNDNLQREGGEVYRQLALMSLRGNKRPIILVDWSDIDARREFFLLRAAIAVKGRSLTVYEEVHTRATRETRKTHAAFLNKLKETLPEGTTPIIVTDAGFRTPWFKQVLEIGWHFVGRIRNRELVQLSHNQQWNGAKALYSEATNTPRRFINALLTRSNPLQCALVLFKAKPQGRKCRTKMGAIARSRRSLVKAHRATEPWLLATSLPDNVVEREVVATYSTRMQIEESFRDLKCHRNGLDLYHNGTYKLSRMKMLVLIGAIANTFAWILGQVARLNGVHKQFQANTTTSVPVLSNVFVGIQIFRSSRCKIQWKLFDRSQLQPLVCQGLE